MIQWGGDHGKHPKVRPLQPEHTAINQSKREWRNIIKRMSGIFLFDWTSWALMCISTTGDFFRNTRLLWEHPHREHWPMQATAKGSQLHLSVVIQPGWGACPVILKQDMGCFLGWARGIKSYRGSSGLSCCRREDSVLRIPHLCFHLLSQPLPLLSIPSSPQDQFDLASLDEFPITV